MMARAASVSILANDFRAYPVTLSCVSPSGTGPFGRVGDFVAELGSESFRISAGFELQHNAGHRFAFEPRHKLRPIQQDRAPFISVVGEHSCDPYFLWTSGRGQNNGLAAPQLETVAKTLADQNLGVGAACCEK